jgi:hypothetical protein
MRRVFGYDLVTHNCVSELFQTVEAADVDVGRRVGSPWSLDFIPFVAARSVDRSWHVVERTTQPSYRRARLDEMAASEGMARAGAREQRRDVDRLPVERRRLGFAFFTDDALMTRPLFGALNVAVGVGAGVVGVATLPFDRGRLLTAGLRGCRLQRAELAFVNLRKGSFDYVPRGGASRRRHRA